MIAWNRFKNSRGARVASAVALVALGAAGGAGAVQATRPAAVMAPAMQTPIAKLAASSGVVTVKGRVAEIYGDRFVVQDASGRAMITAGPDGPSAVRVGQPVLVQGRYAEGQLRASYLVDRNGTVAVVGPRPGGPEGRDVRGPHHAGKDGPPPPPPGCAPTPGGPGALPPPVAGAAAATAPHD